MRKTPALLPATVLFLVVSFLAAGLFGALQPATRIPVEVIQLTQFGPALGVAVAALLWPGRVRVLLAGGLRGRGGRAAVLLVTAPLVIAVSAGAYAALTGDAHPTRPGAPFALIAAAQLIGACGEEIGWRCFLQPLLRTRLGVLPASIAVGAAWGVWHVQVLAQHPMYAGAFLVATVSMSVVMGWALDGTGVAGLPFAGGFHALVNLGMLVLMDEESGAVPPMVLFGASCLVAAVLWSWWGVRRGWRAAPAPDRLPRIMETVR
ncbi:CPBP family intramembrane glutamic endopeptidase [Kitasatospora camelliae]|uniref:CPBP family intramembrane glutamic endopeptidase n=1 Tax=Kitasatospora camelliae TaxID=3156397 RepID=A0AAU8K7A9_9ACTN